MPKLILLLLFFLLLPGLAYASAWLEPAGSFLMETTLGYFVSSSRFDDQGNIAPYSLSGQFRRTQLDIRAIHGMVPKWNLLVNLGLSDLDWQDSTQLLENSGISAVDLLLKYGLSDQDWASALQFGFCASLQNKLTYLELGQANVALELRGLLSKILGPGYLNTELALRLKTQTNLNELRYELAYVYKTLKSGHFSLGYNLFQGLGGDYPSAVNPDLYPKTLHTLKARAALPFSEMGNSLFLELFSRFAGRAAATGSGVILGLCYSQR
jgi:hypothetical protein